MLSVEQAGNIKVAEDTDFEKLKNLCDENSDWKLEYQKNTTSVWTKTNEVSNFKMIKVSTELSRVLMSTDYLTCHIHASVNLGD